MVTEVNDQSLENFSTVYLGAAPESTLQPNIKALL
jgi:hypothetical protein